tara:strand:+ start:498 stop:788 length:291 start_codon:yes stop_codon:yes gene_type:complete
LSEFNTPHADLLRLEPLPAIAEKWRRGRARFRAEGFDDYTGGHELFEAYEEALDLGAYLLRALERTDVDRDLCEQLVRDTLNLIQGVQTAAKGVPR